MKNIILASLIIFSGLACKKGVKTTEVSNATQKIVENTETLTILLSPKSKSIVSGKVEFTETNGSVQMTAMIKGLSEGSHAIHLHEKSDFHGSSSHLLQNVHGSSFHGRSILCRSSFHGSCAYSS